MKKFINITKNILIHISTYIIILLFILAFSAYILSVRNNISFETSIIYLKELGVDFLNSITNNSTNTKDNIFYNTDISTSTPVKAEYDYYYYKQLDDNSKNIYNSLQENIDNLKKGNYIIDFSNNYNDLLKEAAGNYKLNRAFQSALDAFTYDHPELFYIDPSKMVLAINEISLGPIKTYTVKMCPKDNKSYLRDGFNSETEVNYAIQQVESIRNDIFDTVCNEKTYNKIKKVHDMLATSLEYDTTLKGNNIHNIYGAFVEGKVVCEGYAKAFKYILDSLSIECILISGDATNSAGQTESHMWNYVKLDGDWYGVDLTWDDPIIIGGSGNNKNHVQHDYFLKGNYSFVFSHSPSGKLADNGMLFSIPVLSDDNYR